MKKFLFALFLFCSLVPRTYAQTSLPLYVSPLKQQLTLDQGQTDMVTVSLTNSADQPISGTIHFYPFIVSDKEGRVTVVEKDETGRSAVSWLTVKPEMITIPAQSNFSVEITIAVPMNVAPGEHYAAVMFEPVINHDTSVPRTAIQVSTRVGSLFSIRISGEAREAALITRIQSPRFIQLGPAPLSFEILNRGDYQISPKGIVSITNIFGKVIDQQPLPPYNIFPDKSRLYQLSLGSNHMIGQYRLDLVVAYGEHGKSLESTVSIWIIPWKMVAVVILGLFLAGLLITYQRR